MQQTDYYPFGLEIDRNNPIQPQNVRNGINRYNFLRKETQVATGYIDLQARFYDPTIGRFIAVDPMAEKMQSCSPYSYGFNNPIKFVDADGQYPIYFLTRSYASFKTFGPGNQWYGDNRGATLNQKATYRSSVSINYDTDTKQTSAYGGRTRSHTVDGSHDAISTTTVYNRSKGNNIDVHSAGRNEAQTGSWDIDQFTKLKVVTEGVINKDHILNVSGTVSGNDFPNQESMIYDSKGNGLWLGNYETSGNRQWGPVTDLSRENEGDVQMNIGIRVKVNKNGVFQGVMQRDKSGNETMISIGNWNKKFKSDDSK
ncbi:RHS repeat-associated core domain-containing protein [Dyadobacter sp.]|uniref:RHS repeat-associated core domain-containing protein n=1 Tax=Dyadobacter sp. TaxID=1914288 RepID=UPI0032670A45